MGCNCIFRRDALLHIGGFDEEYEYYLEEADVCCSLIDAGYKILHTDWAPVHHKYLSGGTRDATGITVDRRPIVKNQLYFSLQNARRHASLSEILEKSRNFASWHRHDVEQEVVKGRLHHTVLDQFDADVDKALEHALIEGLTKPKKVRESFNEPPAFSPFPAKPRYRHLAILAQSFEQAVPLMESDPNTFHRVFIPTSDPSLEGVALSGTNFLHQISAHGELGIPGGRDATKTEIDVALTCALERVKKYYPFDDVIRLNQD